jgi:hypothetical protein
MLFQLVQLVYWLALSTWFGSVLFIALAAPVIFRTVRENNPILSHVLSVNLDGQHSTLLAGNIVFNLIQRLLHVEVICAALLLVAMVAQCGIPVPHHPLPGVVDLTGENREGAILRSVLFLAATVVMLYDWQFVWPKIRSNRAEYIEHADEPEVANPALDRYDREQRKSLLLVMVNMALLLGIILFSSTIGTKTHTLVVDSTGQSAQ